MSLKTGLFNHAVRIFLLLGASMFLGGCSGVGRSIDHPTYEAEKGRQVTVHLSGEVESRGRRLVRRELSRESILEASGGFSSKSFITPKKITLKRGANTYVIPFDQMGAGRWKRFLLNEGDEIVVNTSFF